MPNPYALIKRVISVYFDEGIKGITWRLATRINYKRCNARYHKWFLANALTSKELTVQHDSQINYLIVHLFQSSLPLTILPHKLLRECINSVLAQTYDNWELCIADGGSTNQGTIEILQHYANCNDKRIKIKFLRDNLGISGNSMNV